MTPDTATGLALGPAIEGFALGAALIIAIGAQNAFVLRQGLIRAHVLPIVAFCALADAVLIVAGALGLGSLISGHERVLGVVSLAGAGFLITYGMMAARRAWKPGQLLPSEAPAAPLLRTLATVAAVTLLNPHVYLDTVVLLGSISGRHPMPDRLWFVGGAALASITWFSALGYGARLLVPVFRRPAAWRVLDGIIALVMWLIGAKLIADGIRLLG
ncbi:LysE/ArgO family amino acid transporter [Tistrella sp. BH-R2-4]|uniref:LysE/ArgO family amino acid transporter n=1 Tax=Tistrella arctica TaxID=3133430 RepID=A0ABU9YM48_9PROT